MPLEGADFSENAKPLAQGYVLAEIERLNLAREVQELRKKVFSEINNMVIVFGGYNLSAWQISYFASSSNDVYATREEAVGALEDDGFEFFCFCRSVPGNRGEIWVLKVKD
jgi:hypothetical protein